MSFIMFIIASTFEYLSFFIFIMVLFRFSLKEFFWKFLLGAVILAFVSNTVQTESLRDISPLVNIVILFFLVTIILRLRLFHSFIVVVIGYIAQSLVQWLLYSISIYFSIVDQIVSYTWSGYALQLVTVAFMCLISFFIYITKGGFSYIQSNSRFYKDSFRGNKLFAIFMIIGLIVLLGAYFAYLTSDHVPDSLAAITIAIVVVLVILVYFSIRKDG